MGIYNNIQRLLYRINHNHWQRNSGVTLHFRHSVSASTTLSTRVASLNRFAWLSLIFSGFPPLSARKSSRSNTILITDVDKFQQIVKGGKGLFTGTGITSTWLIVYKIHTWVYYTRFPDLFLVLVTDRIVHHFPSSYKQKLYSSSTPHKISLGWQ